MKFNKKKKQTYHKNNFILQVLFMHYLQLYVTFILGAN